MYLSTSYACSGLVIAHRGALRPLPLFCLSLACTVEWWFLPSLLKPCCSLWGACYFLGMLSKSPSVEFLSCIHVTTNEFKIRNSLLFCCLFPSLCTALFVCRLNMWTCLILKQISGSSRSVFSVFRVPSRVLSHPLQPFLTTGDTMDQDLLHAKQMFHDWDVGSAQTGWETVCSSGPTW